MEKLGVIHSWNADRGFGLITPVEGRGDVFAHASAIAGEGLKELDRGVPVAFTDKAVTRKGRRTREAVTLRALRIKDGVPVDDRAARAAKAS